MPLLAAATKTSSLPGVAYNLTIGAGVSWRSTTKSRPLWVKSRRRGLAVVIRVYMWAIFLTLGRAQSRPERGDRIFSRAEEIAYSWNLYKKCTKYIIFLVNERRSIVYWNARAKGLCDNRYI